MAKIVWMGDHETQWRYMVDEISKITGVRCTNPPEAIDAVRGISTTMLISWEDAAQFAENNATAIRGMAQRFIASPVMGELATARAEALEEFARACRRKALGVGEEVTHG